MEPTTMPTSTSDGAFLTASATTALLMNMVTIQHRLVRLSVLIGTLLLMHRPAAVSALMSALGLSPINTIEIIKQVNVWSARAAPALSITPLQPPTPSSTSQITTLSIVSRNAPTSQQHHHGAIFLLSHAWLCAMEIHGEITRLESLCVCPFVRSIQLLCGPITDLEIRASCCVWQSVHLHILAKTMAGLVSPIVQ